MTPERLGFWWVLLIALVFGGVSFLVFHDLRFPTSLLDGSSSDAIKIAFEAEGGDVLRRLAIPLVAVVGIIILVVLGRQVFKVALLSANLLALYSSWVIASLAWSDDPELTLRRAVVFVLLLIGAAGLGTLKLDTIRTILIIITLFYFSIGLVNEVLQGTFAPWRSDYRFSGTVHPNLQAATMAQLAIAGVCLALERPSRRRLGIFLFFLGLIVVLLTQSRTSLVALALTCVVIAALRMRSRLLDVLLIATLLLPIMATILTVLEVSGAQFSPAGMVLSLLERPRDLGSVESLTGRVDIWMTLIEMAAARPLLGWGFEAFWSPDRILEVSTKHDWGINQAHSVYIEHLIGLGIIGLMLWCLVLGVGLVISLSRLLKRDQSVYLWSFASILFSIIHGANESIQMLPLFNGFLLFAVLAHLAFFDREPAT